MKIGFQMVRKVLRWSGTYGPNGSLKLMNITALIVISTFIAVSSFQMLEEHGLTLRAAKTAKIEFSLTRKFDELKKFPDGTTLYEITTGIDIRNTDDKALTIDGCVFNTFFGRMPENTSDIGRITNFNIPKTGYPKESIQDGPISWVHAKSTAFVNWDENGGPGYAFDIKNEFYGGKTATGGCAGIIRPGGTLSYADAFFVRTDPAELVGWSVALTSQQLQTPNMFRSTADALTVRDSNSSRAKD